jgi:hypothetical protein
VVTFDGTMPAHGHGLPLQPRVTREPEPGVYLIEGVRFSMPGHWQLWLGVDRCGPKDSVTFDVTL